MSPWDQPTMRGQHPALVLAGHLNFVGAGFLFFLTQRHEETFNPANVLCWTQGSFTRMDIKNILEYFILFNYAYVFHSTEFYQDQFFCMYSDIFSTDMQEYTCVP